MKKIIKLIAAVLMAAVLAFTLCIGLSAWGGTTSSGPIYASCSYTHPTTLYHYEGYMSCSQS